MRQLVGVLLFTGGLMITLLGLIDGMLSWTGGGLVMVILSAVVALPRR